MGDSDRLSASSRDLHVVLLDIAASADVLSAEEASRPRLSRADVARWEKDPVSRSAWRTTRIALRFALERVAGPHLRQEEFCIAEGGRPYLADGPHFSISHSDGAALIAIADRPVGVDIERIRSLQMPNIRGQRIVAAAMRFDRGRTSEMPVLEAWVRLEAIAKFRGTGIGALLTEEGVGGDRVPIGADYPSHVDVRVVRSGKDYIGAVAADALPNAIDVIRMPADAPGLIRFLEATESQ